MNKNRSSRSASGMAPKTIPNYPIPMSIRNILKDFESLNKKKPEELSESTSARINFFNKLKAADKIEILENEYKNVLDLGLYLEAYENQVIIDQEFSCDGKFTKVEYELGSTIYRIDLFKEVFSEDEDFPPQIKNTFQIFQKNNPSNCYEFSIKTQFKDYLLATSTNHK